MEKVFKLKYLICILFLQMGDSVRFLVTVRCVKMDNEFLGPCMQVNVS